MLIKVDYNGTPKSRVWPQKQREWVDVDKVKKKISKEKAKPVKQ